MPGRIMPLVTGGYYHVFNRGSDKRNIYLLTRDYARFQQTFFYYQYLKPKPKFSQFTKANLFNRTGNEKIVEIICFALMSNHFHFLIKQLRDSGISAFMSLLCNSYTKYFNTKHRRIGPLLQGAFKAVAIESEEQLIHASRYIHLNPVVSGIVKRPEDYSWSSYGEYMNNISVFCEIEDVLGLFSTPQQYKKFVENQVDYGTTLELIKYQTIDEV